MTTVSARLRPVLALVLPLLLLGVITLLQLRYDEIAREDYNPRAPIHRFIMPAPVVRHLAFGFENALADYYWVTAVQDINKWNRKDSFYPEYFRIIATLDPRFEYPYMFAILTIPSRKNPESLAWLAIISEEGMKAFPESWEIPFYTAVQHHVIGKSYEDALHYLKIAREKKSAPEMVHSTYAIYLMHTATPYQESRALFATIYETSKNEETKRIAKERLLLLDFIEAIEQASFSYKAKLGKYPTSLEDLIQGGFIQAPKELVNKFPILIDQTTGKATLP